MKKVDEGKQRNPWISFLKIRAKGLREQQLNNSTCHAGAHNARKGEKKGCLLSS